MWRHFILGIYSAFLLGSPTFNADTSSKLTSACCERTALHFCQCSEFAFQALSCLLHLSVPCFCLSQLLQSLYCFKIAKIYLCPQSCHWSDATKLLFCSVLYNKTLSNENQQLVKKTHFFALAKFKRLLCLSSLFFSEAGIPTQICLFLPSFHESFYIKTIPFNFPHCFFPPFDV